MDGFIELHHIETALHNYGRNKQYGGVVGNMVAFARKMSFELNFGGYVSFVAKTKLIPHYQLTINAVLINSSQRRMAIFPDAAKKLVNSYYKNYFDGQ
jgi:hypothetical protein